VPDSANGGFFRRGNDRTRAFAPFILNKDNCGSIMRETRDAGDSDGTSRTTMRAIIRPEDMGSVVGSARDCGLDLEAVIEIGAGPLAYFGRNDGMRRTPGTIRDSQITNASAVMARAPRTESGNLRTIDFNGYTADSEISAKDTNDLIELYQLCLPRYCVALNEEKIGELFMDPANTVALIRDQGRIIAASVAERSLVQVGDDVIEDIEISECATHPDHRARGLMSAIIGQLIQEIGQAESRVVYSESRAAHTPINIAMRNNGMTYCGRLEKAVVIGDGEHAEGRGDYSHMESLNVWAAGGFR
jgi:hypothetical protein